MLEENRALMLVDIMIKKCLLKNVDYKVILINNFINDDRTYDEYELRITAVDVSPNDFLSNNVNLIIRFCFDNNVVSPYISINYDDTWDSLVKIHNREDINEYKDIIIDMYKKSMSEQLDDILHRSKGYFDIGKSEVRDIKINKLVEDEE